MYTNAKQKGTTIRVASLRMFLMINYLGIHQSFDYTQAHLGLLAVLHIISCCLCTHLAVRLQQFTSSHQCTVIFCYLIHMQLISFPMAWCCLRHFPQHTQQISWERIIIIIVVKRYTNTCILNLDMPTKIKRNTLWWAWQGKQRKKKPKY